MNAMALTGWTVAGLGVLAAQGAVDELRPAEMGGYAEFGRDLALQGDLALAGARGENAHGTGSGSVHALRFEGGTWVQEGRIDPADLGAGDAFGSAVSIDAGRAVVGAPGHAGGAGALYVYRREGDAWVEEAKLATGAAKSLGAFAALDGDTALAAASGGAGEPPRIFVFRHDGQDWFEEALLNEGEAGWVVLGVDLVDETAFVSWERPGLEVAMHVFVRDDRGTPTVADDAWSFLQEIPLGPPTWFHILSHAAQGDRLVVGMMFSPDPVRLFERDDHGTPADPLDDLWLPAGSIPPPVFGGFGSSVAIDGDRILVADQDPVDAAETALLYRFDGVAWQLETTLVEPDPARAMVPELALDGGRALVTLLSDDLGPYSGRVSAWAEQGAGTWSFTTPLLPQDLIAVGCFGCAVDVTGGSEVTVLAGADLTDSAGVDAGSAYVFRSSPGGWIEDKLLPPGLAAGDRFGAAVALDGDAALVGADGRDGAFADQGAALLFRLVGGAWALEAELAAPAPSASAGFGAAVALAGDVALVGSPADSTLGAGAGAVDVFRFVGATWAHEQTLYAAVPGLGAGFGSALALQDGAALIGAPGEDGERGAGYVFRYDGAAWVQEVKGGGTSPGDRLGAACSFHGEEAALGAPGVDFKGHEDMGAVYFCRRDPASGTWTLEQKLVKTATSGNKAWYGRSVAHDDVTAIVGAPCTGGCLPEVHQLLRASPESPWVEVGSLAGKLNLKYRQMAGFSTALDSGTFAVGAPLPTLDYTGWRDYGAVFTGNPAVPLTAAPATISAIAGGTQEFALDGPAGEAGKIYLMLGTLSGTDPGLVLGSWTVPINPDPYFQVLVNRPDQTFTSGFTGSLDSDGDAAASLILAPGTTAALVGTTMHHAFVVYDVALGALTFVSNSAPLSLEP